MKTYANIKTFYNRNRHKIDWEDYFMLNGKLFNIYEYGEGEGHDYVYFLNKKSGDIVYVQYDCPSYQSINGERIQTKAYNLYEVEYKNNNPYQWR
jgi:hypothetical protein